MKKSILISISTLVIETVITLLISWKLSIRFIELMFFIGIACSFFIFWFTSKGGAVSQYIDSQNSALTGIVQERDPLRFRIGPAFKVSLLFLLIGLIFFILLVTNIIPPVK